MAWMDAVPAEPCPEREKRAELPPEGRGGAAESVRKVTKDL